MMLAVALTARLLATTVIYLNPCQPDGCVIAPGATDARTGHSDLVRKASTLRTQLAQASDVGGIADVSCTAIGACRPFEPNALAFVFADYWAGNASETCGSIVQQLGHTWALDHVLDQTDAMSVARLGVDVIPALRDGQACGGDCSAGISQFGLPCVGTGPTATHACIGTGAATQDEVQTALGLFGPSAYAPPSLAVQAPANGAAAQGFAIALACSSSDDSAVVEVDVAIDGQPVAHLTAPPYVTAAPPLDPSAAHVLTATCSTAHSSASVSETISVGAACATDHDCDAGELCDAGACIAGSSLAGGLGTTCKSASDCRSDLCVSEGYNHTFCVIACTPDSDSCPSGFSCFAAGPGSGLCWAVDTSGCAAGGRDLPGIVAVCLIGIFACKRKRR